MALLLDLLPGVLKRLSDLLHALVELLHLHLLPGHLYLIHLHLLIRHRISVSGVVPFFVYAHDARV